MQLRKYTRDSITKMITKVDDKLDDYFKKAHLDSALGDILYFYGKCCGNIKSGWIQTQQYVYAQEMIVKCLKNSKNRTRSASRPLGLLDSTLLELEELMAYSTTFGYHNVSKIEEVNDVFTHYIPIEMSEVDAKRVISDWLANCTPKMFISPTEQSLQKIAEISKNNANIENLFGYNYEDLRKAEERLSEYLINHAIEDFQKSQGRKLTRKELLENNGEISAYPLVFYKNKFRKRLRELGIDDKYYESLLLPISSFPDSDNEIEEYPFKGTFIELDSFRFITSPWWYHLHGRGGVMFYLYKNIESNILEKTFELETSNYMDDFGFSTFKLSRPHEIDAIGTFGPYLILVENLYSFLPINIRNDYLKAMDSSVKGRIGHRFLDKYFQIDERYNWMMKEGLTYLKTNPHHKNACKKSNVTIPIILTPDKEMLPDKIGRFFIINTRVFGYLINKITSCSLPIQKIDGLNIIFLPINLYAILSNSAFLPRVGVNTIILPDLFQDDDFSKIIELQRFLYQWEYNLANLDNSYSIKSLLDDINYSDSKDVILLAVISTYLRDIMILNRLLKDNNHKKGAKYLLYLLDNIKNEILFGEGLDLNDLDKEVLAATLLNVSNCKLSTFFDKIIINFLGNILNYSIDFCFPFIDDSFCINCEILNNIKGREDIFNYSKSIFPEVYAHIQSRKSEEESNYCRYISLIFGKDFV